MTWQQFGTLIIPRISSLTTDSPTESLRSKFQTHLYIRKLMDWTLSKSQLETIEKKKEVDAYEKFKKERERKLVLYK